MANVGGSEAAGGGEPDETVEVGPDAVRLGEQLLGRVDELGNELADTVRRRVDYYQQSSGVSPEALRTSCIANLRYVFLALSGDAELDLTVAEATGRHRAEVGAPLSAVLAAYRVGLRRIWELVIAEARESGVSTDGLLDTTAHAVAAHDLFAQAAATSFHAALNRRILDQEQRRSALIDALLAGQVTEQQTLWETADLVQLPTVGPYVVVAASLPEFGRPALPGIDERLASRDIRSVWRLTPDLHIGIVAIRDSAHQGQLISMLSKAATTRVGVSPPYGELADTAEALRLARTANLSAGNGTPVTVFEESPLAIAAVSAPEVMARVARGILGPLDTVGDSDRNALLDTLIAWVEARGSTAKAAEALFLHPNTVRQRLNRVEKLTGKSLTDPSDIAELRLALEVVHRLPQTTRHPDLSLDRLQGL